jgi:hypothetical protein
MKHLSILLISLFCSCLFGEEKEESIHLQFSNTWSGKAPDGTIVSYEFFKTGKVIWRVEVKGEKKMQLEAKYKLVYAQPHLEIDIFDFVDPKFKGVVFRGIIEILGTNSFKMEGEPSIKGDRPEGFSEEAIEFKVVEGGDQPQKD